MGRVTAEEISVAMRTVFREDREANLQKLLLHALRDDLKPVSPNGRWRANPLLVLLLGLAVAATGVFLFFGRGHGV